MSGGLAIISSIQDELPEILSKYKCGLTYKHDVYKVLYPQYPNIVIL